jgi:hypothetical protein
MDSSKIAEAFATLKDLLGVKTGAGKQWADNARSTKAVVAPVSFGGWVIDDGSVSEEQIVLAGEENRLAALGLGDQTRLRRTQQFSVSAHAVSEPHVFGKLKCDGRQFYLDQTLVVSSYKWLQGLRPLLAIGEHVGRVVQMHYKVEDGMNFQICRTDRRKYSDSQAYGDDG